MSRESLEKSRRNAARFAALGLRLIVNDSVAPRSSGKVAAPAIALAASPDAEIESATPIAAAPESSSIPPAHRSSFRSSMAFARPDPVIPQNSYAGARAAMRARVSTPVRRGNLSLVTSAD